MTPQAITPVAELDEAGLLDGARRGDSDSVAELYRRHVGPAERFAAGLTDPSRAGDVVSDAMMKVFALLERGQGPTSGFRSYLFSTVRTVVIDSFRKRSKEMLTDDVAVIEETWNDGGVEHAVEHADVIAAFKSLPERSQKALWLSIVEGRPLHEVGEELGLNANAVAALTFRAREALRQGYLAQHMGMVQRSECERYTDHLPKHVRGKLRGALRREVETHLDDCHECAIAATTLGSINTRFHALVLPAALVGLLAFVTPEEARAAHAAQMERALQGARAGWQRVVTAGTALVAVAALAAGAWWWLGSKPTEETPPPPSGTAAPQEMVVDVVPVQVSDPAVGTGAVSSLGHLGAGWAHVELPVVADERSTVTITVQGATEVLMHSDPQHGQWRCEPLTGAGHRFRCTVPPGQLASTSVAVDLRGTSQATLRVAVAGPHDTDQSNNTVAMDVPLG